jgi:sulfur-carrier protein adenylyltransferase/sulfurtransferase
MLSKEESEKYSRHILLGEVGLEGQLKLKQSSVLVIGAGGLGCPVLQYLNAAGVGHIGIVDFDTVDKSNLQRQILFGHSSLGKNKAEEAKIRLQDNNPFTKFDVITERLDPSNSIEILSKYSIIVDCTDNYETRYLVNDACVLLNKPLVYAAIYKFEGQVSVFNYQNGPTYRCLYPETPKSNSITNCSESGVIGVLPGIMGAMQANEVIKIILGLGSPLSGSILVYNSLTGKSSNFKLRKSEHIIYQTNKESNQLVSNDYNQSCSSEKISIEEVDSIEFELLLQENIQLIDVREFNEEPQTPEIRARNIPLGTIEQHLSDIDPEKTTVIFCRSGKRSRAAIEILQEKYGYNNLINLKGGVLSYLTHTSITVK